MNREFEKINITPVTAEAIAEVIKKRGSESEDSVTIGNSIIESREKIWETIRWKLGTKEEREEFDRLVEEVRKNKE